MNMLNIIISQYLCQCCIPCLYISKLLSLKSSLTDMNQLTSYVNKRGRGKSITSHSKGKFNKYFFLPFKLQNTLDLQSYNFFPNKMFLKIRIKTVCEGTPLECLCAQACQRIHEHTHSALSCCNDESSHPFEQGPPMFQINENLSSEQRIAQRNLKNFYQTNLTDEPNKLIIVKITNELFLTIA